MQYDNNGDKTNIMIKRKKWICWIGGSVAALLILILVGLWAMFGTFIIAAQSIEKLEDGLYSMEYTGDYGFDEFLQQGGATSDGAVSEFLTEYLSHGFFRMDREVKTGE